MIFITLLTIAGFAGIVWGTVAIANYFLGSNAKLRKLALERGAALNDAHRTLRAIANGAGNPVLEAQMCLDDYNRKEIL